MSSSVSSEAVEGDSRRKSSDEANSLTRAEKKLPHYLQPSSGSCHDMCKYGKHHDFEKKPRPTFPKRKNKKPVDVEYPVEIWVAGKKTPELKLKPQHNVKTNVFDNPEITKSELSASSVDCQAPDRIKSKKKSGAVLSTEPESRSPVAKVILRKKMPLVTKSADSQISVSRGSFSGKESSSMTKKVKPMLPRSSLDSSQKVRNLDKRMPSGMLEVSFTQAPLRLKAEYLSAKQTIASQPKLSAPGSLHLTSEKKVGVIKTEQRTKMLSVTVKKGLAAPRGSFSPRSSGLRIQRVLSSSLTLRNGTARGVSSPKASLSQKLSLGRVGRGSSAPKASLASKISISRSTSLKQKVRGGSEVKPATKNQKKIDKVNIKHHEVKHEGPEKSIRDLEEPNKEEVQEKTLYVIKMETEDKYVDSDVNEMVSVESSLPLESLSPSVSSHSKSPSPSLFNHSEQDDEESELCSTDADEEPLEDDDDNEAEHRPKIRNDEVVPLDKDGHPVKLRFRRGKIVDILSESRSPRRLKFRRGRVLGANHNAKSNTKLHFKEGESDGKPDDHQADSETVVLRHQDVQGKKDTLGLFNNVIEETASKLAETRKSKVKALVGAFETVISLQDRKPSASTVS